MKAGLDIVVTNYKTPADLTSFLDSLERYPPAVPYDLTIVDIQPGPDGDLWCEHVMKKESRGRYILKKENIGYARACNESAALGDRRVIALFNADVELTEGALDECYCALLAYPDWAVLGPRQTNRAGFFTHAGIFGPDYAPYLNLWMQYDRGQASEVREDAYSVAGSAYFIRRHVWEQLSDCPIYREFTGGAEGAFLPTELYYEETACSVHARAHGWKVVYYGPARIVHEWNQSVSKAGGDLVYAEVKDRSRAMFRAFCEAHGLDHD